MTESDLGQRPAGKYENPWVVPAGQVKSGNPWQLPDSLPTDYDDDPYDETREQLRAQFPASFNAYQASGGVQYEEHVKKLLDEYLANLSEDDLIWVEDEIESGSIVDLVTRTEERPHLSFHPVGEVEKYAHAAIEYTRFIMRGLAGKMFEPMKSLGDTKHDKHEISDDVVKVYSSMNTHADRPENIIGNDRHEGPYNYNHPGVSFMLVSRQSSAMSEGNPTIRELSSRANDADANTVSMSPLEHFEWLMKVAVETEMANPDKSDEEKRQAVRDAIMTMGGYDEGVRSNFSWNYQMYPVESTGGMPGYEKWKIGNGTGGPWVLASGVEEFKEPDKNGQVDGRVFIEFISVGNHVPDEMPVAVREEYNIFDQLS